MLINKVNCGLKFCNNLSVSFQCFSPNFAVMVHETASGELYTIISGTNRKGSHTEKVANQYLALLESKGISSQLFNLKDFNPMVRDAKFLEAENKFIIPAQKFIFIIPEYNGSYPGVLKTMIDNSDIRKAWHFKKALLTGVATGRAGNLRGMDHLADTLNYLKMTVHYNKLPISRIDKVMDAIGKLDDETMKSIRNQLDEFIDF